MLAIGLRYMTGYAVATDVSSRERAEWPPHPARVFMALAAAWFETGEDAGEGEALRALERAGDPELLVPPDEAIGARTNVTVYVPVNDVAGPAKTLLQSAPTLPRSRQARTMPRVRVGDAPVYMVWPEFEPDGPCFESLASLCRGVTRIGHSSSLVQAWAQARPPEDAEGLVAHEPEDALAGMRVRGVRAGLCDRLRESFGEGERARFAGLSEKVRTAKGKKAKEAAKQEFEASYGTKWSEKLEPPQPQRPRVGVWRGYRPKRGSEVGIDAHDGTRQFGREMIVMVGDRTPRLGLASTLKVAGAMRGTILSECGKRSNLPDLPVWLTGHRDDGSADLSDRGHLAIVPLAFVDHEHADGSLKGLGLVLPRAVDGDEAARVLGPVLFDPDPKRMEIRPRDLELRLGSLGVWNVRRSEDDGLDLLRTLRPERWGAGAHRGSRVWASATPVVLDRFPKHDRRTELESWRREVAGLIAEACGNVGLPAPESIDLGTTSWLRGVPRAVAKQRRVRPSADGGFADMGDGFPRYPARRGGPRPQVHVRLEFSEEVAGPLLLGAGRFKGYGFFCPLSETTERGGP